MKVSKNDNGYDPFAYYMSSGALSFAAWMAILEMQTKAYQDQARMAERTATLRGEAIVSSADATDDIFEARASNISFQMGEVIASASTAALGMIGTFALPFMTGVKGVQSELNGAGEFENIASNLKGADLALGDDGLPRIMDEHPDVAAMRANFRNGNIKDSIVKGIDQKIGDSDVTFRDMLESEFTSTENKDRIMQHISNNRRSIESGLNNVFSNVQMKTTLIQTTTGALRDGSTSGMKAGEAAATRLEGLASKDQQIAQGSQQFMSEIGKSQQDQYQQYAGETREIFRTINEVVQ